MKSKTLFRILPVALLLWAGIFASAQAQTPICDGDTVFLNLSGINGNIDWQASTNGTTFSNTGLTGASAMDMPTVQTWYRAAVTNGTCDTLFSDTLEVIVNPNPVANAGTDFNICIGEQALLGGSPSASGGTPGYTYAWSPSGNLSSATDANPMATITTSTVFTLLVTDTLGCTSSDDISIGVNGRPTANSINDTIIACGDSIALVSSATGGSSPYNFGWAPGANLSDSTIASPMAYKPGLYYLTVTDSNGCNGYDTVQVSYNVAPGSQTFAYTGAMVNFTIPCADTVRIEVFGAQGGNASSSTTLPGNGAQIIGHFTNLANTQVKILVGGQGTGNGGGGGSYVTLTNNSPLVIAGGGGGSSQGADSPDKHGQAGNNGGNGAGNGGLGGTAGSGGAVGPSTTFQSGAGGGLLTNGADGWTTNTGGKSFTNGGAGGTGGVTGGFGGGGSGSGYVVGGGGGGYSGGGSGGNSTAGVGGGGGSFNGGVNQTNTSGVRTGNGQVVITWW